MLKIFTFSDIQLVGTKIIGIILKFIISCACSVKCSATNDKCKVVSDLNFVFCQQTDVDIMLIYMKIWILCAKLLIEEEITWIRVARSLFKTRNTV